MGRLCSTLFKIILYHVYNLYMGINLYNNYDIGLKLHLNISKHAEVQFSSFIVAVMETKMKQACDNHYINM